MSRVPKLRVGDEVAFTYVTLDGDLEEYVEIVDHADDICVCTGNFALVLDGALALRIGDLRKTGRKALFVPAHTNGLGYDLFVTPDGALQAGCQWLERRELIRLWKKIGRYLGYEITG